MKFGIFDTCVCIISILCQNIKGKFKFSGEGSDYLNVAIKEGCLSLTMGLANGKQEMQIKPNKVRFDDNQWHKVSVHRKIQEVNMWHFISQNTLYSYTKKLSSKVQNN